MSLTLQEIYQSQYETLLSRRLQLIQQLESVNLDLFRLRREAKREHVIIEDVTNSNT